MLALEAETEATELTLEAEAEAAELTLEAEAEATELAEAAERLACESVNVKRNRDQNSGLENIIGQARLTLW